MDASATHWTIEALPWHDLRSERVAGCEELFFMLASASFIETTTDLYARNLVQHFADDPEVSAWLNQGWEPEELQHGRALRSYVERVWPDFDWQTTYAGFFADYSQRCTPELLQPMRSLEMASRCVVEMGTASYYTALNLVTTEPVLVQLTRNIYEDEVNHYKHFFKYFRRYREIEKPGRAQVLGALWNRLKLIDDEDSYMAIRHVYAWRNPGKTYNRRVYKEVGARIRSLAGPHLPHQMSVNMLLKPLDIAPMGRRMVNPLLVGVARMVTT